MKCPKCRHENPEDSTFCGKCATKLGENAKLSFTKTLETPLKRLEIGSLFADRYQILETVGKGGMGEVYRVKDEKLDEEMALKVLRPDIASDREIIERFKNELKLARKITHRHVCKMYDLNEEGEIPFITMEYVKGENLKTLIKNKGGLKEEDVIDIAKQVCEGLNEAHELGVVHRDLKPQNIMIDEKGNAKIMDFGIARSLEAPGVTKAGVMIGTPDYISPEQTEGSLADRRSDLYSLGVIIYEMATGHVPFKGDTAFSIALQHKTRLPQDPRKINPRISEKMSRLILICMEKNKERRYQNAKELLDDLRNIEEGFPLGTKIRPRREIIARTLNRKRLFIPVVILTLAVIAVLILQRPLQKGKVPVSQAKPSIAVLPFVDLSPLEDQAHFCDGLAEELINRLTRIENLRVPARTSSFSIRGKELDIKEIGKILNVENALEGSISKSDNRLRIIVRLIKVEDGYPIWDGKYERNLEDIFALRDELSLAIVDNLKIELLGEEKTELIKNHTQNWKAYELYLQGQYFRSKRTEESLIKSVKCFEQAIELDPSYALAYAELAITYNILAMWNFLPVNEAYSKARTLALKALELDETLAEAHLALADIKHYLDWDWEGAEKEVMRAIELNPRHPTARLWHAEYKINMGQLDEALEEIELAKKLDPLSLIINADASNYYYRNGEYNKAIEQAKKTIEMDPSFRAAHVYLANIYNLLGMYEEALGEYELIDYEGAHLGFVYARMGRISEANKVLEELIRKSSQSYGLYYGIALLYFYLGDKDNGFTYLDRSYKEHENSIVILKIDEHIADNIRADPRFKALLKKMNLG